MTYKLPPRTYHVKPFMHCIYRVGCWPWWKYWGNPMEYWYAWREFYQRGRRGWADNDIYSLDWYVAEWMGDALHKLHTDSITMDCNTKKGLREYTAMIAGWDAALKYMDDWDQKALLTWEYGSKLWRKKFFSLWW